MRLLLPAAVAAVGFCLAGHVRGQYRNGLGILNRLAPPSWPQAIAEPPMLAKRDGSCASGSHPCSDINSTSCCDNDQYCIINYSWENKCCAIGSNCENDSPCDADQYFANETVTTTISTAASSASLPAVSTITRTVCSGRSCTGSLYGCPSSLGGHCCGFGMNCATDTAGSGICIGTSSGPSSTTTATTPTSTAALPTGAVIEHKSQGLSTGAKAGIAIGVIVVAALVIGAMTYLCLRRQRRRGNGGGGSRSETTTAQELPSMTPAGRPGDNAAVAPHSNNMSEADGYSYGYAPSSTGLSRGGNGPAQGDYFGQISGRDTSGGSQRRPPGAHARVGSQGSEADGSQSELADTSSRGPSPAFGGGGGGGGGFGPASPVDSIAGRFELWGDPGHGTPASGHEMFHDAQESVVVGQPGPSRSRTVGGGVGSGTMLPQPFPTPGSEMSEFGTPSPMSREETHPRREA